jgi:DNA-binding transcriptional ArsR family regulator
VSDLISAMADPNRRRILELLRSGERTVTDLAAQFTVTRPAISQHLGVLTEAELVEVRREGKYRFYRLNPTGMSALRAELDSFWNAELHQLVAEATKKRGTSDDH